MFVKPALTIQQQIVQLQSRGLQITSADNADHHLSHISYYRLAGYWWPFQADKILHLFKPGSKFSDVMSLYSFDRELRILLFEVIEKIEISLRTKLIYHLSHEFDPWWFENVTYFISSYEHAKTLDGLKKELNRSKDAFIKEHKSKHQDDARMPPAWKTLELTSLGCLSKLYGNLKNNIRSKKKIAQDFGVGSHIYLPSWLLTITQIRNFCAHHSRLWNKNLPGEPKLLPNPPNAWVSTAFAESDFPKLYVHLCCMKYLLNVIQPGNHFTTQLTSLLTKYPNVDPNALGLTVNWQNEPLWVMTSSNQSIVLG